MSYISAVKIGGTFQVVADRAGARELRALVGSDLHSINGKLVVKNANQHYRKHPALNSAFKDSILQIKMPL